MFAPVAVPGQPRPLPQWPELHQELRRKGMTLFLLWQEYKAIHPRLPVQPVLRALPPVAGTLDVCLRQEHKAGEKMFVDWAGQTVPVTDPSTGQTREAQIFVAVLGRAITPSWRPPGPRPCRLDRRPHPRLGSLRRGQRTGRPDNTRTGVTSPIATNPTSSDLPGAGQPLRYGGPAGPRASAARQSQSGKRRAQRGAQLLAPLRHRTFFSLAELNQALREKLAEHNERPFQENAGSRRSLFETLEQPVLKSLPPARYEFAQWKKAQVHIDYHVEVEGHYYSVPYQLVRQQIEVRLTATTVECFHQGQRVASHPLVPEGTPHQRQRTHAQIPP